MTKMLSRRRAAAMVVSVLALFLIAAPVLAATGSAELPFGNEGTTVQQPNICARISVVSTQLQARLTQLRGRLQERSDERTTAYLERKAQHQERALARTQAWETRWEGLLAGLDAQAGTSSQEAALLRYKTDMRTALAARKAAVDAANTAFRTALNGALVARNGTVAAAADPLKTAVKAAFDKALDDCADRMNERIIRQVLMADLESAYVAFRASMRDVDRVSTLAREYADARRDAIEKAQTDFKAAAQKARDDFKASIR